MAAKVVPDVQCYPDLLKKLDKEDPDTPEPVKLMILQRQELLLAALKKDEGWIISRNGCLTWYGKL